MVETAIILPVILLLIMGIIDFGLLFNNFILVSNAAREGARRAALGGTDTEIMDVVQNLTTTLDPARLAVFITPAENSRFTGDEVTVQVTYDSQLITPMVGALFDDGIPLNTKTIMRVE